MERKKDTIILAFDTSCDETSVAVVRNGREPLSNIISSQIESHAPYGGVVPELASRKHIESIDFVTDAAIKEAGVSLDRIDCVAATYGPGLVGALLTGLIYAKTMAFTLSKPFIGVNHIEGHICSNYLETDFEPPFVCLVVSGGHTELVYVRDYHVFERLGATRDDAAGEAFDKVARVLGLPYPGGPHLDKLASLCKGDAVEFPRAYLEDSSYDFSFSGVKSAVINYLNKCNMTGAEIVKENVAAGFQNAVLDVLTGKTAAALTMVGAKRAALAGGVASNSEVRRRLSEECARLGICLSIPKPVYCTDNAAMIGSSAYYKYLNNEFSPLDLNAEPSLKL